MPTTLRDIALATGVTEATVSNAINNRGKMSDATRERILNTVQQMGYIPNKNAKNLASNQNKTIGIIVPDLENPFYGRLVRQVSLLCKKQGYHTLIADSFNEGDTEEQMVHRMVSERISGLLIVPINYGLPSANYIPLLEQNNIRYCFLTNRILEGDYPFVMTNLGQGTFELVKHLLDTGRRNIYFLAGRDENLISTSRIDGYHRAYSSRELTPRPEFLVYCDTYDFNEGYSKTTALLHSSAQIDAIITLNDFMATGVLSALSEAAIPVPKQIAVAGYDNMFFTHIVSVPLTTVRQDIDEMCRLSVNALFDMIAAGHQISTAIELKPELIIRNSTLRADALGD